MPRFRFQPTGPARAGLLLVMLTALTLPTLAEPPHVMNGPEPRDGVHELKLEEVWRHGGEDDDIFFGLVSSVATDPDGNLYVLDSQLAQVMVFSPDGEHLRDVGRQGSGPGEYENPNQVVMLPDGTLGVSQLFPGKLVRLSLDGTPRDNVTIDSSDGGFAVITNVRSGGGNLVIAGMEAKFDQATAHFDRHLFVRSYDLASTILHEYFAKDQVWDFSTPFTLSELDADFVWFRMAVDHQGRLVVGEPREDYAVSVYAADGTLERVFGRAYEPLRRDKAIKARFQAIMDAQLRQMPPGTQTEVADMTQTIWGIYCHPDGTYWVTTARGMYTPPQGVLTSWDVFGADGEFLRQVEARVPGKPGVDMLLLTDHGYALEITGFWDAVLSSMGATAQNEDAEAMEIICYKVLAD
ncbi:MAG: 6-bladed beta-propeller [Candidatus Krumholzibacteriia bacterium]